MISLSKAHFQYAAFSACEHAGETHQDEEDNDYVGPQEDMHGPCCRSM
jgi:hypothetical protein